MKRLLAPAALMLILSLGAARPAGGQARHNSTAPIDFRSAGLDVQDKANRAILTGGVVITQAELTLRASRVTVAYTGAIVDGNPSISRIDAVGGVTVNRPGETARSQYAVYDLNRSIITMIGSVELTRGTDVLRGPRLVIDLNDNHASIGGGATGSKGGQVTGRFSAPKRASSPAPVTTPQP